MIKFPLLTSEDIEVKVKQVTKTGALLLLYKTARVDAQILDEAVGPMNWECSYTDVKGTLFCSIGIRENPDQDFVYKMDCGIESDQDDGNEKKAEASDAFKRTATKWGIGRELYTSPQIWADVATEPDGNKFKLKDKFAKYVVTHIGYNENTRKITELEISNANTNVVVFRWALSTNGAMARKMVKTLAPEEGAATEAKAPEAKSTESTASVPGTQSLAALKAGIKTLLEAMQAKDGNREAYKAILVKVAGDDKFRCNAATEEQYDTVKGIYDALMEAGYGG